MKIPKETLRDLTWLNARVENFVTVLNELTDRSRWSVYYRLIIKDETTGKFYETSYECGATENQDTRPWEWDDDPVELIEVKQVTREIIDYVPVSET